MSRLSPFFLIGLALVAWELAARSGLWSPLLFPSLASIAYELGLLLSRADRLMEAWHSLYRALGGFALAAVVGVALGMLMGRSAFAAGLLEPLFSGTYAVPKLALSRSSSSPSASAACRKSRWCSWSASTQSSSSPARERAASAACCCGRRRTWALRARNPAAHRHPATAPFIFAGFRVALPVR